MATQRRQAMMTYAGKALAAALSGSVVAGTFALRALASAPGPSGGIENPLNVPTFPDLISAILNIIITVGIPVAAVFLIYAGFMFVTARGNETQLATARRAFFGAVIGTLILVGAQAISSVITDTVNSLGN